MGSCYGILKHQADCFLSACCDPSEQHAVDELLQLAVKGGDIDGQVLAYLELAQVCLFKVPLSLDSFILSTSRLKQSLAFI